MFKLIEVVKQNDKESQAWYPFESATEAKGEYESKLGANMKSDAYQASLLILIDNEGDVIDNCKVGEDALSPRLIEVKVTNAETTDISKYETPKLVEANFHSKWGAAIKNQNVRAETLLGINGDGSTIAFTYWVRPIEDISENGEN